MENVRLGIVRYLNTAPLVEGLTCLDRLTLVPGAPSRMIGMLERGEVDLALASVVDAVRAKVPVTLVPAGMIGCDGATMTVRLFSRRPIGEVRRVHADSESHTSVVLCRLLLKRLHGVDVEVVEYDARERVEVGGGRAEESPEAMLLIGNKVVTDPPRGEYPHQMDLGEAWKELTGLPFVYAVWMCRTADATSEKVRFAGAVLDRQRRHNMMRLEWIVRARAGEHRWPADLARRYLGELLRYDVGERERSAAERFVREAAGLGLLPAGGLAWWEGAPAEAHDAALVAG